ncbi:MAG: YerC/YecD family TrpR-related protein [bacterium]|nr:YerC/YecD family TrpR-related protein [bacterium]
MSKGMNKNTKISTVRAIGRQIDWDIKQNRRLIEAVLALRNKDEAERFLRDLMTESEIKEFADRLEAASLLYCDVKYNAIEEKVKLSSTTVARIAKWLNGPLGGYRLILNRISNHHSPSRLRKGLYLNS